MWHTERLIHKYISLLIGEQIQDILVETQTTGVRVDDSDIILGFKRANSYFNSTYKMPTTERTSNLLVFSGVYEYPKPDDFAGWFAPQRPYGMTTPWFVNTTQTELTTTYYGNQTSFKFDRENQFLVVSFNNTQSNGENNSASTGNNVSINECDSLTDNGSWAVSGDGTNLIVDSQIFVSGSGSLRFTVISNTGSTVLTCTSQNAVDLATMVQQGFFFLSLDCPQTNTTALTNVKFRLGSTAGLATDYYEFTTSTWYRGDSIKNGFNQVGFNALDATTVGSPNSASLTYMTVTLTGAPTGIYRLDNIFAALPTYFQLPYYSKYNVKADDGTYKLNPTATDDTILCPDEANDALVFKCLEHLATYNLKNLILPSYFSGLLQPFENILQIKYVNQDRKTKTQWYNSPSAF